MDHFTGVDFEDLNTRVLVGEGELDLSVQTA